MMVLTYASVLASFEGFAQVFSVAAQNPMVGMLFYMNIWFAGERVRGHGASAGAERSERHVQSWEARAPVPTTYLDL
jgi:hypothetical protein